MRQPGQALQLRADRMIGEAHPGVREIGNGLAVQPGAVPEVLERDAAKRQSPYLFQEVPQLLPLLLPGADKLVDRHSAPSLQRIITIRTPENIELPYALAGAGTRAAAYFMDFMIMLFVGQILINFIIYAIQAAAHGVLAQNREWAAALGGLMVFGVYNGYFILFEWLLNGQTPGKRLLQIRVIKEGGYALKFVDTLLRNLLRVVDFIPLFYGVGLASLLLTRHSQRLGDLAAGTLVVYQHPERPESLIADVGQTETVIPILPADQVAAIPQEVLNLAAEFFLRRSELAPRARQEIGAQLVDLIRRTSGLAPERTQSAENFLGTIFSQGEQTLQSSGRETFPA